MSSSSFQSVSLPWSVLFGEGGGSNLLLDVTTRAAGRIVFCFRSFFSSRCLLPP
jgi:hypothetical protein